MNKEQAIAEGYLVDSSTYPWVAYKGPRFNPIAWIRIDTPEWKQPKPKQEDDNE